jgi:hypothetical protein
MRTIILLALASILLFGCAGNDSAAPAAGQPAGSGQAAQQGQTQDSGQSAMSADAELNDCIENICGTGNDSITKICTVSCWEDYAVAKGDPSYCDKNIELINSTTGFAVCVEAVAKSTNDPSPCGLISGELYRDLCYVELAKWLDDPSVCDKVDDTNVMLTKADCLNALNEE